MNPQIIGKGILNICSLNSVKILQPLIKIVVNKAKNKLER